MSGHFGGLVNAKKQPSDDSNVALADAPPRKRGGVGWKVMVGTIVVLAIGVSVLVWDQVGDHVRSGGEYQIDAARIAITQPPAWIHADIKVEVLHDIAFVGPLSLLDSELTVRMAGAFAAHPWVAHVERVSKRFPAGLDVVLSYRKPVAMVEVEGGTGALPVDADGVLLPTSDFTADDAEAYPRIGEIHTMPAGPAGKPRGDPGVAGAAQIVAALAGDWKALDLFRIVPSGQLAGRTGVEPVFHLITRSGTQVRWGRAPTTSLPGEVPAAEKIAQLKRFAAGNNGSLDLSDGAQLEIRDDGALLERPRPQVKPLPKSGE
jgi:hypothetical protein